MIRAAFGLVARLFGRRRRRLNRTRPPLTFLER